MIEILQDRALLHITGPDSGKFLQSITTNNVIKNIYSYNYLLNNQGRYLFDFFVYQQGTESYFIDVNKSSLDALLKRLTVYKLRSNLDIRNVSTEYNMLYSKSVIKSNVEFSLQDTRYNKLGYRSMIKSAKIDHLDDTKNNLYLSDKYNYSIIDGYIDLAYDRSIPTEYGAEELNAIDYNKGCYVGQEVISRIKYQGVVRKKIFKLQNIEITHIDQETKVTDLNGNKLGVICSYYKNQAIALLREENVLNLEQKIGMIGAKPANILVPTWRG